MWWPSKLSRQHDVPLSEVDKAEEPALTR